VKKHPTLVQLGLRLRMFRERKNVSQEQLALRADLDRTYVGGVERGERNLGTLNLLKIASALNVNASALLKGISIERKD
jgi:transcriptional regulator with XRE-family HTH domain